MTQPSNMEHPARQPLPLAMGYCAANWLVPGLGFLLTRDWARGIGVMVLINGVFLLGLAYDGYLIVPALNPRDRAFNVFAALTFIVQLAHGGGFLAVYAAEQLGGPLASLLVKNPGAAYSDLGGFHFAVAGGLNYFATVRLWDLMRPDGTSPEGGSTGQAPKMGSETAGGSGGEGGSAP